MKKFLPYILILTVIVQIFAPFTVGINRKNNIEIQTIQAEAADCEILQESFTKPTPLPNSTNSTKPEELIYSVNTNNCIGKLVKLQVLAFPGPSVAFGSPELPIQRISANNFSFTFHTGEKYCEGGDCNEIKIKLEILNDTGTDVLVTSQSSQSLAYKCSTNDCEDRWVLKSTDGTDLPAQTDCKVTKVLFIPPTTTVPERPDNATLYINTSDCQGQLISDLNIRAKGTLSNTPVLTIPRTTINSDSASFSLKTGEKYCTGKDCDIIVDFQIRTSSTGQIIASYTSKNSDNSDHMIFRCKGIEGNCDETAWSYESSTGVDQTTGSSSTTTVYYFNMTGTNGHVETSPNFATEDSCKKVRDEKAEREEASNSGIVVSECTSKIITQTTKGTPNPDSEALPACSLNPFWGEGTVMGCVAQAIYYLFFKTTSFVFALAGKILDFTIMYSIDDTSYRSSFVVEGWGLIRDFCNIFFIFILLYIAIGTILNLHGVKPKEMIINVVIIGLLINFSLFATQVIIDASNILTRVFYNQKTIITGTQKDAAGNPVSELGDFGEIKLSEAIVSKIDPQKLILQSSKISALPQKDGVDESTAEEGNIGIGTFILVVFLATAVNVVGTIAFLSSALIFIGRVVMLWLAMIFAPLAFFSYIVPKLKGVKMIGWENWWPDTLKMAFVAPVFVFFMYLIVGFMSKGLDIVNSSMKDASTVAGSLSFVIAIVVPFIFMMILLMRAKSIAVDMSGEMGATMAKAGAAVGGVGLAVATGGAAMAMRGTVGRLGNKLATSSFAKNNGMIGRGLGNMGKWAGSKSFDVRATKLGGMAAKELGVTENIGKAKEGGYAKHLSDKVERRQKRAKELEVSENEDLKQDLNREERALEELSARNSHPIEALDKQIKGANDASAAAAALVRATDRNDPQFEARQAAAREAAQRVIDLRTQRSNIKNAIGMASDEHGNMVDQSHNTDNGLISVDAVDHAIAEANRTQAEVATAENQVITATTNMTAAVAAAAAAETAALNAAAAAANTAIANATPQNLAASAAARTAAAAATANVATVRATSMTDVAVATAAATAARTAANNAGTVAANYVAEAQNGTGRSMNHLEDHAIPDAHHAISRENRERKTRYARAKSLWGGRANREAEHKIIMDTKIDTKEKH